MYIHCDWCTNIIESSGIQCPLGENIEVCKDCCEKCRLKIQGVCDTDEAKRIHKKIERGEI